MYFSSLLLLGVCVCMCCAARRGKIFAVPRPFYRYYKRERKKEEEENERVVVFVCSRECVEYVSVGGLADSALTEKKRKEGGEMRGGGFGV